MAEKNYTSAGGSAFEVRRGPSGNLLVKKDGEKTDSSIAISPASASVRVDHQTQRVHRHEELRRDLFWVYARGNKRVVSWPGGSIELDASDLSEGGAGGSGSLKPLKLTMPGKVLAVNVKEGDIVEPGQGLVIVEAMKMENLLLAAAKAKVAKVHIKVGDRLESGAVLITFQAAE